MNRIRFDKSALVLSYWIEFTGISILPLGAVNKAGLPLECFPELLAQSDQQKYNQEALDTKLPTHLFLGQARV
jgi:hypothetical protein